MTRMQWQSVVTQFQNSGLSKSAFAKQQGLVYSQLLYWIRQFGERPVTAQRSDLVPVKIKPSVAISPNACATLATLVFPNGTKLEIHTPELLSQLAPMLHGES